MTKERFEALIKELEDCECYICVAHCEDDVIMHMHGDMDKTIPSAITGIIATINQMKDRAERYRRFRAAIHIFGVAANKLLKEEWAATEKAPEAAATAPSAKEMILPRVYHGKGEKANEDSKAAAKEDAGACGNGNGVSPLDTHRR